MAITFGALAALSCFLTLWQFWAARRFPLHRSLLVGETAPALTIFKPLKMADRCTADCLESWLGQAYPGPLQFLFGVASADDPAAALVETLLKKYPDADADLCVCPESLGLNGKISTLAQLEPRARFEIFVVSDSDVWIEPDFLAQLAALLTASRAALVHCFYKLPAGKTLASRWEALAVNADFWSQALQAASLRRVDFALGAVMAFPREQLRAVGGFIALADYLADDFQLGRRIRQNGGEIRFASRVVECRSEEAPWRETWRHQLRWTRTIRVCQPTPFSFSILANPLLWPLLWMACAPGAASAIGFAAALAVRQAAARANYRKLTGAAWPWKDAWLIPLKDLLHALLWAASFAGRTVVWRGQKFRVLANGKLRRI